MNKTSKPRALWVQIRDGNKPPKPRKRLKPRSAAYEKRMRVYRKEVKVFLKENPKCSVWQVMASTQVHHKFGRRGRLLLWKPGWKAVSDYGQTWCHHNIDEARERGLIGPEGTWNDYERAVKHEGSSKCL
jgi:hypothetical protein